MISKIDSKVCFKTYEKIKFVFSVAELEAEISKLKAKSDSEFAQISISLFKNEDNDENDFVCFDIIPCEQKKSEKKESLNLLEATPPKRYDGTISQWMVAMSELGLWDGKSFYGDVLLTSKQYFDLLNYCEKQNG